MLEFRGEYGLSSVDERERCLSRGSTGRGAEGPQHALEVLDPVLAVCLELVEFFGLQPLQRKFL